MTNPYASPMQPPKPMKDLVAKDLKVERPGWATFLGISLAVLGPIRSLLTTSTSIGQAERQSPELIGNAMWTNYKTGSWISMLAFMALSVFIGYKLLRVPLRSSVKLAKYGIWIVGPLAILVVNYGVGYLSFGATIFNAESNHEVLVMFVPSVIFATLWTLYLFRSTKVKAWYA